jgi:diguanylate cyclase (GGDEF)-like protein
VFLFPLPLVFAGLSYPVLGVIAVAALDLIGFGAVVLSSPYWSSDPIFIAFLLGCAALLCGWQARNREGQESRLMSTARALRSSEKKALRREIQQHEIAALGQRALSGAPLITLTYDAVSTVQRVLGVETASILELMPESDEFMVRAAVGLPEGVVGNETIPTGRLSQVGFTLMSDQPVIVEDWSKERRFSKPEILERIGAVCGVTVLIKGRGKPFGALGIQSTELRPFGQEEVSFLQAIANVLAGAIERQDEEENARRRALHDPLTGLPNRALFADHLSLALTRQERRGSTVAVIFMDLDNFKLVNDTLGHQAGDQLLKAVAPRLKQGLRPEDTVARFGGDEFAVLLEEIQDERDATLVAERIASVLARPFVVHGREHFVTASMGIAIGAGGAQSEALIRDSDAAMYRAKELGRARYEIFDEEMRFRLTDRLRVENELRLGIERGELRVHYQPVVALSTGRIAGAEALVRWEHPERGLLAPAEFISVAEEGGLIVPLGRFVLEESCRQAAAWHEAAADDPPLEISVNLSTRQLSDPELTGVVRRTLEATRIEPACVSLELTENVLMEESEAPLEVLRSLKELGIRLVVDDFGTGYSSLGYLKRLPFDAIKLDRTFVEGLGTERVNAAIVSAVTALAQTLGLSVIAEGVETGEQLELVRELGCHHAQGFLFSRPVPAEQFERLLGEGAPVDASALPVEP